jgi:hypothetical protein
MVHWIGLSSGNIIAAAGERDRGKGEKWRSWRSGAMVGGGQWIRIWAWVGGSLLTGGLGLDVAMGFCLGGGGVFRCQQWAGW